MTVMPEDESSKDQHFSFQAHHAIKLNFWKKWFYNNSKMDSTGG